MKRILGLTLSFAALSLVGCPPAVQPVTECGTGTSAPSCPASCIQETTETVVETVEEKVEEVKEAVAPTVEAVKEAVAPAVEAVEEKVEEVKEAVAPTVEAVKEAVAPAVEAVEEKTEEVKEAVAPTVEAVKEAVEEKVEEVKEAVAPTVEAVKEAVEEKVEEVKEAVAPAEEAAPAVEAVAPAVEEVVVEEVEEVVVVSRANPPQPKAELNPVFKPTMYANLPDFCPVPDGMTLDEKTNVIYLNCPNYVPADENGKREFGACLMEISPDGKVEKVLDYPAHPESGKVGSMGIDICPSGNLYTCDNQFFSSDPQGKYKSRILRVERENGKVTGKVTSVIEGITLANAILWDGDNLYVTDTVVPKQEGDYGRGGVWKFTLEEIKKAVENNETIKVDASANDPHLIVTAPAKNIGRGDGSGADGMTKAWGAIYFGNFGDGVMHKLTFDADGKPVLEKIIDRDDFQCCDGIFYDSVTDLIYIDDSQANAIRTLDKDGNLNILWMNPSSDGSNGDLDQPAECIVRDGKLIIANFDWTFPGLVNETHDKPYTLSAIDVTSLAKTAEAAPAEEVKAEESAPAEEVKAEEAASADAE